MAREYRFVLVDGAVFRMSRRSYRKYLQENIAENYPNAYEYGTNIGTIELNVTRANKYDFEIALDAELNRDD